MPPKTKQSKAKSTTVSHNLLTYFSKAPGLTTVQGSKKRSGVCSSRGEGSTCRLRSSNTRTSATSSCHLSTAGGHSPENQTDLVLLGPSGIADVSFHADLRNHSWEPSQEDLSPLGTKTRGRRNLKRRRYGAAPQQSQPSLKSKKKVVSPASIKSPVLSTPSPRCQKGLPDLLEDMKGCAKQFFGIEHLNPFQASAIEAFFQKKDVFVVVSTGAGKSLCYQLPPLMPQADNKFVFVISPLISLMQDQVVSLAQKGVPAMTFSGNRRNAWADVASGLYRLVYASPEFVDTHWDRIANASWIHKVLLVAIDECHCVSEWGHHFRPTYRKLARLRLIFPQVPFMFLTATATAEVRTDVARIFQLHQSNTLYLKGSVNRQNIYYRVVQRQSPSALVELGEILQLNSETGFVSASKSMPGSAGLRPSVDNSSVNPYASTLIYVATKQDAESIASALLKAGARAAAYHAGMTPGQRSKVHHQFLSDEVQVVCATVAFGMGIDKPDVRRIIHWCLPTSIEAYVQQAGRAGRDRLPAEAIIMWAAKDLVRTRSILLLNSEGGATMSETYKTRLLELFESVIQYVQLRGKCRREYLLKYFGEIVTTEASCMETIVEGTCCKIPADNKSNFTFVSVFAALYARNIKDGSAVHCFAVGTSVDVRCRYCDVCLGALDTALSGSTLRIQNGLVDPETSRTSLSVDLTQEARVILRCVLACRERTGTLLPCKVAVGSKSKEVMNRNLFKAEAFGQGTGKPLSWWREFLSVLCRKGLAEEKLYRTSGGAGANRGKVPYLAVRLTPEGRRFLDTHNSATRFILKDPPATLYKPEKHLDLTSPGSVSQNEPLTNENNHRKPVVVSAQRTVEQAEQALFDCLTQLRLEEARTRECAPFMVLPMPAIKHLIANRPTSVERLLRFTPQVPRSLPSQFLQALVDKIQNISSSYGLPTDLSPTYDASQAPNATDLFGDLTMASQDVVEEPLYDTQSDVSVDETADGVLPSGSADDAYRSTAESPVSAVSPLTLAEGAKSSSAQNGLLRPCIINDRDPSNTQVLANRLPPSSSGLDAALDNFFFKEEPDVRSSEPPLKFLAGDWIRKPRHTSPPYKMGRGSLLTSANLLSPTDFSQLDELIPLSQ